MENQNDKMPIYKIARPTLGLLYRLWYRPKIMGKENIPRDGSILLVGNHVHIMDQCNVIISTKRCIHYMAKKEYFDHQYKEGKFPWFFKGAGCIPVDRNKKDEEAVSSALEVLNNGGALGLFPEGTRNGLKEERIKELYDFYGKEEDYDSFFKKVKKNKTSQINYLEELYKREIITEEEFLDNLVDVDDYLLDLVRLSRISSEDYYENSLLPFKFGAVSMAQKTDSYLVPFAITGKYSFLGKNLKVRIGEPFKVGEDLEEANNLLRQRIKSLMKENDKDSGK